MTTYGCSGTSLLEVSAHTTVGFSAKLNGIKHLISGNHDRTHPMHRKAHVAIPKYAEYFQSIQSSARHRLNGTEMLLSHFPYSGDHTSEERYAQWRLPDYGVPLLHGHVHAAWISKEHQLNVGWDHQPLWSAGDIAEWLATG